MTQRRKLSDQTVNAMRPGWARSEMSRTTFSEQPGTQEQMEEQDRKTGATVLFTLADHDACLQSHVITISN